MALIPTGFLLVISAFAIALLWLRHRWKLRKRRSIINQSAVAQQIFQKFSNSANTGMNGSRECCAIAVNIEDEDYYTTIGDSRPSSLK